MAKLDLEWLTVFDEIYRTASVSKAAERLGISQAAASTALIKLRAHYGDTLFSRTARGMQPTPYAQAIQPSLRAVLDHLEQTHRSRGGFEPSEARRTFRIGMTDISEIVILPTLLNHLRQMAPGVQVDIEKISTDSVRRLQDGEVDLAVGFMPQLDAGFYQQVLFAQNFVCLVAVGHPRIAARLSKAAFSREGHVLVSSSGTGHAIVDKVLERAGVERSVVLRVPSFLGVARIVAETELIATVPQRYGEVMATRERIRLLPVPHALPQYDVKQHWHERFHTDPGNAWLRRTIFDLLGDTGNEVRASLK
ncbi:LysR family transcriptional regulator [Hydrogenophaga sp. BPS33]|uniref:LysR family transcriptional regulator n=1 Tax=Hydrogenophaga sp. BPS33 TaxID=2651974 RepID=UPI00131F7DD9|nr:LysR family transcriptional regulator [Hydrogenophaga sp. BPS33]QHE87539.1 LysR family transcriptional regulator [Hydrogenophaga sp. BPS33]